MRCRPIQRRHPPGLGPRISVLQRREQGLRLAEMQTVCGSDGWWSCTCPGRRASRDPRSSPSSANCDVRRWSPPQHVTTKPHVCDFRIVLHALYLRLREYYASTWTWTCTAHGAASSVSAPARRWDGGEGTSTPTAEPEAGLDLGTAADADAERRRGADRSRLVEAVSSGAPPTRK